MPNNSQLASIKEELNRREETLFSKRATLSRQAFRESEDTLLHSDHRQAFAVDTDRILHSLAYTRYIDKTQVFSLVPNDHITHRVLHVQLVSKIARTVGRFLKLNEDLIEAISLGHDIGHPPFGHDGEKYLSKLCEDANIGPFLHSVQGVHFLRYVEKKGRGCNLTIQVLDGILCHDGESSITRLTPQAKNGFTDLDRDIKNKQATKNTPADPKNPIMPMTAEGCVVRLADVISYIGRDIEDAIRLGLITRKDIPSQCKQILGDTNGKIVYTLVEDLILNSVDGPEIGFSKEVSDTLLTLRDFNMDRIYTNPKIKTESHKIERLFNVIFKTFLEDLCSSNRDSVIFTHFLDGMDDHYIERFTHAEIVRDFISGMTDAYFLRTARNLILPLPLPEQFQDKDHL